MLARSRSSSSSSSCRFRFRLPLRCRRRRARRLGIRLLLLRPDLLLLLRGAPAHPAPRRAAPVTDHAQVRGSQPHGGTRERREPALGREPDAGPGVHRRDVGRGGVPSPRLGVKPPQHRDEVGEPPPGLLERGGGRVAQHGLGELVELRVMAQPGADAGPLERPAHLGRRRRRDDTARDLRRAQRWRRGAQQPPRDRPVPVPHVVGRIGVRQPAQRRARLGRLVGGLERLGEDVLDLVDGDDDVLQARVGDAARLERGGRARVAAPERRRQREQGRGQQLALPLDEVEDEGGPLLQPRGHAAGHHAAGGGLLRRAEASPAQGGVADAEAVEHGPVRVRQPARVPGVQDDRLAVEHVVPLVHHGLERARAAEGQERPAAARGAAEADGVAELLLGLGHGGVVEGQLLALVDVAEGVDGDGEAAWR